MNESAGIVSWLALGPALLGWILPGWQVARRLALPAPALAAFLLSACGWFALVLGLQLLGVPLTRSVLLPAWLGAGVAASLWLWLGKPRPAPVIVPDSLLVWRQHWPWLAALTVAAFSLAMRAGLDPSHGWDTSFRWDHLPRLIIAQGNLDFYPPTTAAHYELYAWCDGIPPLASLLNLWIYSVCGTTDAALLAGRTLGEAAVAGAAVTALANRLHGRGAAWPALAVLGSCALFPWSVSMGQETGLTAIATVALAYYLVEYTETGASGAAFGAGLAATIAAISRDYAVAFAPVGLLLVASGRGLRPRGILLYLLPLALVAAPWYARNWVLTGNPLYPNSVFGIFHGHPVLDRLLRQVSAYWSFSVRTQHLPGLLLNLGCLAGASLLGVAGLRLARSGRGALAGVLLLSLALWAWSAQLTAGGWNYSLRVLAPSVGLLAAAAGWMIRARPWLRYALAGLLLALSIDAARRAWLLPITPAAPPLPYTFEPWRDFRQFAQGLEQDPLWAHLVRFTQGERILVDSPSSHVLLGRQGGTACMLFSPAARPCFEPAPASFADGVAALRSNGIRLIMLSVDDAITKPLVASYPFLRQLAALPPSLRVDGISIYDLAALPAPTDAP